MSPQGRPPDAEARGIAGSSKRTLGGTAVLLLAAAACKASWRRPAVYSPTILAAAGVAAPAGHVVDGARLDLLLTGRCDSAKPDEFLVHFPREHRMNYFTAYRRGGWKVVCHCVPSDVSSGLQCPLFNLARDPFESPGVATVDSVRLGEMMTSLKGARERQRVFHHTGADGRPLTPALPRPASGR